MTPRAYRFEDLAVDLDRREVRRDGALLELAGLSFDLFAYLLAQGPRVVGFDELIAGVWAPAVVGEETVTQRVKLLRQSLGDDGRRPRYVRSVRGKGYQLCAAPQPLDAIPAAAPAQTPAIRIPGHLRRWLPAAAAAPLLAGLWLIARAPAPDAPHGEREEVLQRARYYAGIGQKDDVERAIGFYQQLLARDGADRDALVGLSFAYSTRVCLYNQPPEWADRAQALAEAALATAPRDAAAEAALGYAHDCRGAMGAAVAHYERAVALDPGRVDTAASLAYLYMIQGRLADALARNLDAERRGATRPRFLDIQIARNLELLGETAAAERRYARSFRLYPDNVYSNAAWPRCLFLQGRLGEAEAALAEARQRSEHPELYLLQGELALLRGRYAEAAEAFAAAARLRPHAGFAQTLARRYAAPPPPHDWLDRRVGEVAGDSRRGGWPEDRLELAVLQLARGDRAAAVIALQAAVEDGWRDRAYLQTSALFQPLAGDPAFVRVLEDVAGRVRRERGTAAASIAAAEVAAPR